MWRVTGWAISRCAAGIFTCCLARDLAAQNGPALTGRVTDNSTGRGVPNAEIILLSDSRSVRADSAGAYTFRGLPVGVSVILVRALGFPAVTLHVELAVGEHLVRLVSLDSSAAGRVAQQLPATVVTAEAVGSGFRLVDFERRRLTGRGQYRDAAELAKSGANALSGAMVSMRGVAIDCRSPGPSANGCAVHMARAPTNCFPEYVVDGQVNNDFGPLTPIRDVVGLEVYTGPSDVPGEFAGSYSGCGVIVIWTKSGPTRKKP